MMHQYCFLAKSTFWKKTWNNAAAIGCELQVKKLVLGARRMEKLEKVKAVSEIGRNGPLNPFQNDLHIGNMS